jgi:hypothetical protein
MHRPWFGYDTHALFMGGPGSGKSIRTRLCTREKVKYICPVFSFDYHGGNFYDGIEYPAYIGARQPHYFFNFSRPDQTGILGWSPFKPPAGAFLTSHISRLSDTLLKPWGVQNAQDMPTYERMIKIPLAYSAVTGEPLHHSAHLLDFSAYHFREKAIEVIPDYRIRETLRFLQHLTTLPNGYREWNGQVLSSQNRLDRIVGSEIVKLVTGTPSTFSIEKAWEEGAAVFFNLTPNRKYLSPQEARTIAALLLDEIMQCALDRANDPREAYVYLDEAQEYASPDIAPILEASRKSGLRLTFVFHHEGEIADRPRLLHALRTTAECKVYFKGLPAEERRKIVDDVFAREMAERMKKEDRFIVRTDHELEEYQTRTENWSSVSGSGSGHPEGASDDEAYRTENYADASGGALTTNSRYKPHQYLEVLGQYDFNPEEKRLILAQKFDLQCSQSIDKLPDKTRTYRAPFCHTYLASDRDFVNFMETHLRNNTPLHAAQQQIQKREEAFLAQPEESEESKSAGIVVRGARGSHSSPEIAAKRKTRPPRLFNGKGQ